MTLCECGCGSPAPLAQFTVRRLGYVKGQPQRFVKGHHRRVPASVRFWARVEYDESSRCLLWTGQRDMHGYGLLWIGDRHVRVHRLAYERARGPIPDGRVAHHRCGNRACVHPLHLTLLSSVEHGHHHHPRSAVCVRCGESDWHDRRDGRRDCRACRRRRYRERYAADPVFRAKALARTSRGRRRREGAS